MGRIQRPLTAELLADEARIDRLQLAYRNAAAKYAEAAVLVAAFDRHGEWGLLMRFRWTNLGRRNCAASARRSWSA